jgi:hypothetical protein
MIQNIRQTLFQMLVLAEYPGDKEKFITQFLKKCQKTMLPGYASSADYYFHLQRASMKGMNQFIKKITPTLRPDQVRNLTLLTRSCLF